MKKLVKFAHDDLRGKDLIIAILALTVTLSAQTKTVSPSSRTGWAALKTRIDPDVAKAMEDETIVGMTVAASPAPSP